MPIETGTTQTKYPPYWKIDDSGIKGILKLLITQEGTNIPTGIELYNSINKPYEFDRDSPGSYILTFNPESIIIPNKTLMYIQPIDGFNIWCARLNDTTIGIYVTTFAGAPSDDVLNHNSFTLEIYK